MGGILLGLFTNKSSSKQGNCWTFISEGVEFLVNTKTFDLPLREAIIIKKCIEFYDDSDPCYIHRSAVMTRLYFEMDEIADQLPKKEKLSINQLPSTVTEYLELPNTMDSILIS